MPCLLVLDDLLLELARIQAREDSRPTDACRSCGERNPIPLAGSPRCYQCNAGHATEADHVRGSGSGPAVFTMGSNAHRITNEAERIWRNIAQDDLCTGCMAGFPMRVGIVLARLEVAS
jgi:hypothetical protein